MELRTRWDQSKKVELRTRRDQSKMKRKDSYD